MYKNEDLTNLWKETIDILREYNKTWEDVVAIYGEEFQITKENFEEVAKETNYYKGYGAQHVASDLVIIGNGFAMSRGEYDGFEWWNFLHTGFDIPKNIVKIKNLDCGIWSTLKEINEIK